MRIRSFCKNIEINEVKQYELKNCEVVVDAQNYFYNMYYKSGLPFEFGCESDKYAQYVRKQLSAFKKANVKCYFIFKGGHDDIQRRIKKEGLVGKKYNENYYDREESRDIVFPIFMKEVYKEVLNEMKFDYVICELESKRQCIAMAQKLNCPIISFDIEFCFSGVSYIPYSINEYFRYDETRCAIPCALFSYNDFMNKYNLNKEKIATFIVLTDEKIFPENTFDMFFKSINLPTNFYKRNLCLLKWLSKKSDANIANFLRVYLKADEKDNFIREKNEVINFICRAETPGIPVDYLVQGNRLDIVGGDPLWFEKGVACGFVALQLVNIYHYSIVSGSWSIEDTEAEDAMFLSLDIIKYAFNLLTNFQKTELEFYNKNGEIVSINVADSTSVP